MGISIAIDGPAGAGNSTIAKKIAEDMNFVYIDTGAMYRAMGLYFYRHQTDLADEKQVDEACQQVEVSITYQDGIQQVWLNGENVTGLIRTKEMSRMSSACAAVPKVREKLVELQRKLASRTNVVMDGRDIGTVVLPDAQVKIFLTASADERARRRVRDLELSGEDCNYEQVRHDILMRDHQDMTRAVSPLKKADDAVEVDTSCMDIQQAVSAIMDIYKEKTEH